jgi:multiple sugar transport system permease protein
VPLLILVESAPVLFSIRRQPLFFAALMVPSMLLVGGLIVFPLLNGVWLSFTNATPLRPVTRFVGLENFQYLLEEPEFFIVVYNTVLMVGTATAASLVVGFCIALLLSSGIHGVHLFRTAIFQVWVVPWIVIAILWAWLFNTDYGLVNYFLLEFGIAQEKFRWLFHPVGSRAAIIAGFTWRSIPFTMVVSLAALEGIPRELLESAAIDGAGYFRQLRHIILPLLRNILLIATLMQAVRLFQEMTLPWVLTQGGPVNATMVLSMFTYKLAFENWDFGLASTVGTLWLCFLLVFAVLYVRFVVRSETGS